MTAPSKCNNVSLSKSAACKPPKRFIQSTVGALVLFGIVPNLPFWIASSVLSASRPVFNLDYLLIGVIFTSSWQKLASTFLAVTLLADVLVLQRLAYPAIDPQNAFYLLTLLPHAALSWRYALLGLIVILALIVYVIYHFHPRTSRLAALTVLGVATVAYGIQNIKDERNSDFHRIRTTISGSQLAYFININASSWLDSYYEKNNPLYTKGYQADISKWIQNKNGSTNKKILLIIVESLGVMQDDQTQRALLQPLLNEYNNFEWIKVSTAPAATATAAAEINVLCGLGTHYLNLASIKNGFESCLPWHLRARNYHVTALHGATKNMYDRNSWYPRLGFNEVLFAENTNWTSHCYSFPGVCDKEIMANYIRQAFQENNKRFVYWLTLNSHAPYDKRDIWSNSFDCHKYKLSENSELCRMNKLHAQFFIQLAKTLSLPEMRGVEVLLQGDHPPYIVDRDAYRKSVVDGIVTKIHLKVKD